MVLRKKKGKKKEIDKDDMWIEDDFEDIDLGFEDVNEVIRRMQQDIERMFPGLIQTMMKEQENLIKRMHEGRKPIVYGFSIKMGPEGVKIEDFGNVKPEEQKISKEREPLVDIIKEKDKLKVVAELPGVSKKDIKISLKHKTLLSIKVEGKFYKEIELPAPVKKDYKMQYKNGVLELDFNYA